jgi:uroporphyrinogen decarboxylase
MSLKELFLRACRREAVPRVPVWMMRQAGRYLPEYQAVRAKHSFLEICKTPELAAEVSLQPFRTVGVDAIIVFSDILIVAEAMGMALSVPDSGPVLANPVRNATGIRALHDFDPERETKFVGDAIRAIRAGAGPDVPIIGFAAAPWTLACYMIEGQTRGDISTAKQFLRDAPELCHKFMKRIARVTAEYLRSQIRAGADVIQLFDTWAVGLDDEEYLTAEVPATRIVFEALESEGVPRILFAKGSARHLEHMAETGADVLSVDWQTDLADARRRTGNRLALQGNVDPSILLGTREGVVAAARDAVGKTGGLGHILNLGHGILPSTPVENAKAFVEAGKNALKQAQARAGQAD